MAVDPASGHLVLSGGLNGQYPISGAAPHVFDGRQWLAADRYRGRSGTWPPQDRDLPRLLVDRVRQRLLLVGGEDPWGPLNPSPDPSIYEYRDGRWTDVSPAVPVAMDPYSTHYAYDEARDRIVAFTAAASGASGQTWEWDGSTWTLVPTPRSPAPRAWAGMAYDAARQRTVLFGGHDPNYQLLADTWEWDGAGWQQVATSVAPPAGWCMLHYDAVAARCVAYSTSRAWGGQEWAFDGTGWQVRRGGVPRIWARAATYDEARQSWWFYGASDLGSYTQSGALHEWDGARLWRRATSPVPDPGPTITHAGRGRVMVFPGVGRIWERTAAGWVMTPTGSTLTERSGFALAYDPVRDRAVAFGGSNGNAMLDETLEWSASGWQLRGGGPRPPARTDHAMAYDPASNRVLLFGGASGTAFLGDTWAWDGSVWQQHAGAGPSPRSDPLMATDAARGVVVLCGGQSPGWVWSDETWEWTGAQWQLMATGGGPWTERSALTFDARRGRVVGATWERWRDWWTGLWEQDCWFLSWDGASWTVDPPSFAGAVLGTSASWFAPQPACLAFDPVVQRCVMVSNVTYEYGEVQASPGRTHLQGGCFGLSQGPWIGVGSTYLGEVAPVEFGLYGIPGTAPFFLGAGLAATHWNGQPLPLDLTAAGLTNCHLAIAPTILTYLGQTPSGYERTILLWDLPADPRLLGIAVGLQGVALVPSANPAGLLLTNALEITPGLR